MMQFEPVLLHFLYLAKSTNPDENFQLNKQFIYNNYFSYKNSFHKIFLYSEKKSRCIGK